MSELLLICPIPSHAWELQCKCFQYTAVVGEILENNDLCIFIKVQFAKCVREMTLFWCLCPRNGCHNWTCLAGWKVFSGALALEDEDDELWSQICDLALLKCSQWRSLMQPDYGMTIKSAKNVYFGLYVYIVCWCSLDMMCWVVMDALISVLATMQKHLWLFRVHVQVQLHDICATGYWLHLASLLMCERFINWA